MGSPCARPVPLGKLTQTCPKELTRIWNLWWWLICEEKHRDRDVEDSTYNRRLMQTAMPTARLNAKLHWCHSCHYLRDSHLAFQLAQETGILSRCNRLSSSNSTWKALKDALRSSRRSRLCMHCSRPHRWYLLVPATSSKQWSQTTKLRTIHPKQRLEAPTVSHET